MKRHAMPLFFLSHHAVAWTPLTNSPVLLSNEWRVTLPAATNGQRFFRLQTP
jgi:hypothetical protein